jgi:hypothetical protein
LNFFNISKYIKYYIQIIRAYEAKTAIPSIKEYLKYKRAAYIQPNSNGDAKAAGMQPGAIFTPVAPKMTSA